LVNGYRLCDLYGVPRDADKATLEACRLQLEKNLNELNEKAENLLKG